jgi:AcrR family transcriptional regulator
MAPATRRRMPAAQRREVILGAAEEAFARSGYHGTSLDDVAHAAGVSKALIYEHFASKRELHGSLLDARAGEIFRRLEAAAERGATGEERLRSGIDAFLRFVEERREAWRALFRDAADPEVAALVTRVQARATGVIARLIAADPEAPANLAADSADRATRIEIHAQLLSGAVQSLATWWQDHREIPRTALVDRAMEFCWHAGDSHAAGAPAPGASAVRPAPLAPAGAVPPAAAGLPAR